MENKGKEWIEAAKDNFAEALSEVAISRAVACDIIADTRDAGFKEEADSMETVLKITLNQRTE